MEEKKSSFLSRIFAPKSTVESDEEQELQRARSQFAKAFAEVAGRRLGSSELEEETKGRTAGTTNPELDSILETLSILINQNVEFKENRPIFHTSFGVWRKEALKLLDAQTKDPNAKKQLIHKMDFVLFPQFARNVRTQYAQFINVYNFGLDSESAAFVDARNNQIYHKLVRVICKWLVNVETIVDLMERVQLYGVLDYQDVDALKKCKGKWRPGGKIPPMRHIIKACTWNMALRIHSKLSSTIYGLLKSFAIYNFPITVTFGFSLLRSLLKGSTVSSLIAYPVAGYCGIITCGILAAIMMHLSEGKLQERRAIEDVYALISCFQDANSNISDLLRQTNVLLVEWLDADGEKRRAEIAEGIRAVLDMLITKQKPVYAYDAISGETLAEGHYLLEYFKTKQVESDWVHITKVDMESAKVHEEQLENDLLNLSVRPEDEHKDSFK